jgi:6,7-dimethyl-8-ribityllumazine synthase
MKTREIEGSSNGKGLRIGIAMATFNRVITDGLLTGAMSALAEADVEEVTVVRVPGALEVPLVAQRLARTGMDAVVAIGAVIEGETDHYAHVATQASEGLRQVALETGVPVANAVLTVREFEHARDRSLPGQANKGYEAARAAVATVNALKELPAKS